MAGELPGSGESARSPSSWPRGWIAYTQYRLIHDRYMEVLYREALLVDDSLVFEEIEQNGRLHKVALRGELSCSSDVRVRVLKWMDVRYVGRAAEVLTNFYQYHAWQSPRRHSEERSLLRYDQAHDAPHCHRYGRTGVELPTEVLTLDQMPRLDAVVREAVAIAVAWDAAPRPLDCPPLPPRRIVSATMSSISLEAAQIGVIALQAGTPEALTSVIDKWLDEHLTTEVVSMEMQVVPNGAITVLVVYRRERTVRR